MRGIGLRTLLVTLTVALGIQWSSAQVERDEGGDLGIARFSAADELIFPGDTDRWVYMGASLGGDYSSGEFDPENPGRIGVVQMEPNAYGFLLENGAYADGTMFLLSFFQTQETPNPALNGFVQGDVVAQEIHVIDRTKYQDGRGFYLFSAQGREPSAMLPAGNDCVRCHEDHGLYDGTFTQFYPAIRDVVRASGTEPASE